MTDAHEELLVAVAETALAGVSLQTACSRHAVPRWILVEWVSRADDGKEPWQAWLMGIQQHFAEQRVAYLTALAEKASKHTRRASQAMRDLANAQGAPSALERELRDLRAARWRGRPRPDEDQ